MSRSQVTSEANPADPKGCLKLAVATTHQTCACGSMRLELDRRLTFSWTSIMMSSTWSPRNLIYFSFLSRWHPEIRKRCAGLQADWVV